MGSELARIRDWGTTHFSFPCSIAIDDEMGWFGEVESLKAKESIVLDATVRLSDPHRRLVGKTVALVATVDDPMFDRHVRGALKESDEGNNCDNSSVTLAAPKR